jgi:RNA polymerase sigma-70 factor, ECF subfamily
VPALHDHEEMLQRYLFVLGARVDRLEDLVQEVFALVLQKGMEGRSSVAVGAFLRAVAKNLLLRDWHSKKVRREVELADEIWCEQCADDGQELRLAALRQCVAGLPKRARDMLQRAYVDRAGRVAMGSEFGLVANGVKTALRRLRAGLRVCVERRLGGQS